MSPSPGLRSLRVAPTLQFKALSKSSSCLFTGHSDSTSWRGWHEDGAPKRGVTKELGGPLGLSGQRWELCDLCCRCCPWRLGPEFGEGDSSFVRAATTDAAAVLWDLGSMAQGHGLWRGPHTCQAWTSLLSSLDLLWGHIHSHWGSCWPKMSSSTLTTLYLM